MGRTRHPLRITAFRRRLVWLAVASCFAANVHANPTGASVAAGSAAIHADGKTLTVVNTPGAIINWQGFSIQRDEITRFIQQGAASAVLNRVTGGDPSVILGQLVSNGRVFLINPNGVTVGAGARIDVAGFVASSLALSNEDFLAGRLRFVDGGGAGKVVNQGAIRTAEGGQVYLIAPNVENHGVITSPRGEVILAAGRTAELATSAAPHLRVQVSAGGEALNVGSLVADAGRVGIYGAAIRNAGTVSADSAHLNERGNIVLRASGDVALESGSVLTAKGPQGGSATVQAETGTLLASGRIDVAGTEAKGGEARLLGERVALLDGATVEASGAAGGGTVLVGGDFQGGNAAVQNASRTYVGAGAAIRADAAGSGEGGRVIVWADEATRYAGTISARGGPDGGDGGFVEVSGKNTLGFEGAVDTSAPKGAAGTLLLDPTNITVVAGATPNPPNAADGLWAFGEDPGNQNIGAGAINTLLTANNLTLQATNNITVNSAISYTGAADRTLTLQANNTITVSQAISATTTAGRLGVVLNADADASGAGNVAINNAITTRGGALVATGQNVTANTTGTTISTVGTTGRAGGDVTLTAAPTGAVTLSKAIAAGGGTAGAATNGLAGGDVTITGGTISVTNVTTAGSAGVGAGARAGGAGGAITLDASGATPAVTLGGNLDARGGNGVNGGTGGAGGAITVPDPLVLTGNRQVLSAGGTGGTASGGAVQLGDVNSNLTTVRRAFTVTAGNAAVTLGNLGATNPLGAVNVSGLGIAAASISTVGLANGNGANVALNAGAGALEFASIDTSGGARTTNGVGRNGGAVTLTSNATTAGAITTRGSNGLGGNNAGGNGGAVTMNGSGLASSVAITAAIDTRGGDSVGTGNTGNGGAVTLRATDGGSVASTAAGAIDTSGGRGQAGGAVVVNQQAAGQTIALVDLAGAITTSGGNGGTNAAGRNAGNVTVNNARTIALAAVTARGGNSGGGNAVGGNGGAVAITRAGAASTMTFAGEIDTRGGDSAGTGNTGTGGAVTIDGGAAPELGSIAFLAGSGIDTRGGRGQTGGNVIIRDASSVASDPTASIDTSGGTGVTTGKNAGTVTMTAGIAGPVALGSVTARGSAAVAANAVGGNGGNIAVTSLGATLGGAIVTSGGDGTGTAAGGTSGAITINGGAGVVASTGAGSLTTRGARGSNGANVTLSATAAGSVSLAGAIDAAGGAPATGQTGRAGGAVSVTGGDVRVAAITTDGGAAAAGNGGNAGAITLNANDATPVITLTGDLSARGGNAAGGGTGGTGSNVTLPDPVRLGGDVTVDVSAGTGGAPAARNVAFQSTVDSEDATARTLAVNAAGTTTFTGAVGAANALAGVTTDAPGTTAINGGAVRTTGAQTYNDNLTLGAPTTLTTTSGGDVTAAGSVGAGANALTLATGSGNATLVNAANNFSTVGVTSGNNVALRDANAINLAATTVNGTLSVTAGGAITQTGAATVGGATTLAAGANAITLANPGNDFSSVTVASGGNVSIVDADALAVGASNLSTLTARTLSGDLTLAGNLTATGGGDAIVLATAGDFRNGGGFSLAPGTGRWLVWSTDPANDDRGGLAYAFKQYNATYGVTPVAGAGNGFLYSVAPAITPGLSGSATKTYDGTVTAPLAALTVSPAAGVIDGDAVSLAFTGAAYIDRDAGTGKTVTATGVSIGSATNGAATVYGYQLAAATASAPVGTITARPITVSAQTDTKVYDGTTASGVVPIVTAGSVVAGDTASFVQTFDTKSVGTGKTLTASGAVADGNAGNNYAVTFVDDASGVVTARPITVSAQTDTRVYDGTTASSVVPVVTAGSVVAGDTASFVQTFDTKNAGTGKTLAASGAVDDGNGGNNYAVTFVNDTSGAITQAALTIRADDASRLYGDPNPAFTATYTGLVAGETPADVPGVSLASTATPASHVGSYAILVSGGVNPNYAISYLPGALSILPAPLTITADDASRPAFTSNPPFSATYAGFRLVDGPGNLSGTLSLATPATVGSPPGSYPIAPSGVTSLDYDIRFVDGTLVVTSGAPPVDQAVIAGLERAQRFDATDERAPAGRVQDDGCVVLTRNGTLVRLGDCFPPERR